MPLGNFIQFFDLASFFFQAMRGRLFVAQFFQHADILISSHQCLPATLDFLAQLILLFTELLDTGLQQNFVAMRVEQPADADGAGAGGDFRSFPGFFVFVLDVVELLLKQIVRAIRFRQFLAALLSL
jgi:hypothetical protein